MLFIIHHTAIIIKPLPNSKKKKKNPSLWVGPKQIIEAVIATTLNDILISIATTLNDILISKIKS